MSGVSISMEVMGEAAARKMPDGWEWCIWTRVEGGCLIQGGIPQKRITRGPSKGRPNWRGVKLQTVVVTVAEAEAEFLRQEAETGHCRKCKGTGQTMVSWSVDDGETTENCSRCCGTGTAS
jgi:hypothetical protein